jgi:hypothetical protein
MVDYFSFVKGAGQDDADIEPFTLLQGALHRDPEGVVPTTAGPKVEAVIWPPMQVSRDRVEA